MRSLPHVASPPLAPVDVFRARCEARAILVAQFVMELADAVDVLQHVAERDGLVSLIGQDAVQEIMASAFRSGAAC